MTKCYLIIETVNEICCGEFDNYETTVGVFLNKEDAEKVVKEYNSKDNYVFIEETCVERFSVYSMKEIPLNSVEGE